MRFRVSLFGEKAQIGGWLELLNQERIPFDYKGNNFKQFSLINILVGCDIPKSTNRKTVTPKTFFIIEQAYSSKNKKTSGLNETPQLLIRQRGNHFILVKNISALLTKNRTDRSEILNLLKSVLIQAFERVSLPYIYLWYYPMSCKTIFLLRQDVDYIDIEGVENLHKITLKFDIRGTYFVNISGEEEYDEKIGHLKLIKPTTPERKVALLHLIRQGNEIANHGYWHWVFKDFKYNFDNIKKCSSDLLTLFHIKPRGFASPGAEWNENLAKAIDNNDLLYSCNGLSDGGHPYYPYVNGEKAKTLEIPFSFFCDASLQRVTSRESQNFLRGFYLTLIEKNTQNREPIAILGHPHLLGKSAKKFYSPILRKIQQLQIPNFTIEEFASWWKQREKINISCHVSRNKLTIKSNKSTIIVGATYRKKQELFTIHKGEKLTLFC